MRVHHPCARAVQALIRNCLGAACIFVCAHAVCAMRSLRNCTPCADHGVAAAHGMPAAHGMADPWDGRVACLHCVVADFWVAAAWRMAAVYGRRQTIEWP